MMRHLSGQVAALRPRGLLARSMKEIMPRDVFSPYDTMATFMSRVLGAAILVRRTALQAKVEGVCASRLFWWPRDEESGRISVITDLQSKQARHLVRRRVRVEMGSVYCLVQAAALCPLLCKLWCHGQGVKQVSIPDCDESANITPTIKHGTCQSRHCKVKGR